MGKYFTDTPILNLALQHMCPKLGIAKSSSLKCSHSILEVLSSVTETHTQTGLSVNPQAPQSAQKLAWTPWSPQQTLWSLWYPAQIYDMWTDWAWPAH